MPSTTANGAIWQITSNNITVNVDTVTMALTMQRSGGSPWGMVETSHDLTFALNGHETPVALASADEKQATLYEAGELSGVRVVLRGFRAGNRSMDVSLAIIVAIDGVSDEPVVRVIPVHDPQRVVREVRYPRPFVLEGRGPGVHHVLPSMQGALLPTDWPGKIDWWWIGLNWTRAIYMPWWGAIRPGDAYMGILETPFDGGLHFCHPPGGPTEVGPKWHPSMGSLSYPRQVRYHLFGSVDHNALVARYREYARTIGRLKTLETKATEVPGVKLLQGTTVATGYTLYHIQPDSHYYHPDDPGKNHNLRTFEQSIRGVERLREIYPTDRLVYHLDGWGTRGYDNLHPDYLPPCEEAGGWDGFKKLAEAVDRLGWLFTTHDNYIDYYLDAPTYREYLARVAEDGTVPGKAWWYGGAQTFLCEKNALGFVRRNFEEILRRQVPLRATYLDVFSIIEMLECYHPDHPMRREQSLQARAECFEWVRSRGIVLSSEEPTDWSVPYIDFCYWAPVAMADESPDSPTFGIPVPLFNQTYHDCVVTPAPLGKSGAISEKDAFLYALLYGCPPIVAAPEPKAKSGPGAPVESAARSAHFHRAKILADVHRQTGFAPIEAHDLLNTEGTARVTRFAGGASIEGDFAAGKYRIVGLKGFDDTWQVVPA
ncbi:MAG: Endo-alpha-N-acetylgalactosaminidase glycoside hydrolase [Candidatus Latescibacteria bacterium ADurb.Bin168]|nr:MAG: Endo-alpha-N-acetylgalactosaminidase glycoside hydrolase [Candidatus Latescibacteria bacterium ADurb.Bin168]